jgi:hypothetical protein
MLDFPIVPFLTYANVGILKTGVSGRPRAVLKRARIFVSSHRVTSGQPIRHILDLMSQFPRFFDIGSHQVNLFEPLQPIRDPNHLNPRLIVLERKVISELGRHFAEK